MDNWALSFILSRWEGFWLKRTVERKGKMVCKDCCIPSLGEYPRRVTGWSTWNRTAPYGVKGTEPSAVMYDLNCTEAYMERIILQEDERLPAPRLLPVRERRMNMLLVPEYHLFTSRQPAAGMVGVSLEFLDHAGCMPPQYVRASLLKRMVSAANTGALRFMSFDEWLMWVVEIVPEADGQRFIIWGRHVQDEDQCPKR